MKNEMNELIKTLDDLIAKLGSQRETYTKKEYEADCSLAVNSYIKDLCKKGLEDHKRNSSC
tara:strand:- start:4439 stop:4621 length:183 start_codon:yes stop_codon:yes gene_type:complete